MVMLAKRLPKDVRRKIQREMGVEVGKEQKYGNERVKLDGYSFDSLKERDRYLVLLMRKKMGEISELQVHPRFRLEVKGEKVCTYVADFSYVCRSEWEVVKGNALVVEDVKSRPTAKLQSYRIKKKLMQAIYGIKVQEI